MAAESKRLLPRVTTSFPTKMELVVPDDDEDLPMGAAQIYVAGDGNVQFIPLNRVDDVFTTLTLPEGSTVPCVVRRIGESTTVAVYACYD